jgi:enamine deaminase RidA (YjgF/YER057c/UK114 family)
MTLRRLALLSIGAVMLTAGARAASTSAPAFAPVSAHGGLVYASAILPPEPAAAEFSAQATRVLDELKARLAGAGTSIDRVVSATVYLASADDFAALNAVWTQYWPASRPTRTTVVAKLPVPGARLQVSAIAAAPATTRDVYVPAGWPASTMPYNPAIRAGGTVFLSGLVSRHGIDNAVVRGDIEIQTRTVFESAKAILETAGLTFADVVCVRVFLTNAGDFDRMNAAYRAYFPADPPARATVMTALTSPDYLIEITMTAVKGGPRAAFLTPNADGTRGRANPNLSPAIGAGPRLFLSGMLGVVQGGAGDLASQTTETLNRLQRTMAPAGFGWPHVVDSVVYVTDISSSAAVLDALRVRAGGHLPAGTLVCTGLMSPDASVEIMLTAGK